MLSLSSYIRRLAGALWFGVIGQAMGVESTPSHPEDASPSRILRAGDWEVEVMHPTHLDRYNTGVRFTPLAAVLQVRNGKTEFCFRPVPHDPLSHHAGLCNEFDLTTSPPGFEEAKIGEGFVKIGVGVLKKSESAYAFFRQHEVIERAVTTVKWSAAGATFSQACPGINGYSYRLEATVRLEPKGELWIDWALTNTGEKALSTATYNHNFFQFFDPPQTLGYELYFPYPVHAEGDIQNLQVDKNSLGFLKPLAKAINVAVPYPEKYTGDNTVELRWPATGQRVVCTVSRPGIKLALHAAPTYVCPEQFINIKIEPGATETWTWHYEFHAPESKN